MKKLTAALLGLLLLWPATARADGWAEDGCYTVYREDGTVLFTFAGEVAQGDEYISADNQRYVIRSVQEQARTAQAVWDGEQAMPDIGWLDAPAAVVVSAQGEQSDRLIALYATHSDESYEPTDGTASADDGDGGIYDVCDTLKAALEAQGVRVILDETSHVPHDAGAYRRSRQTAIELLKQGPDALIDVHRDGIPDPEEYEVEIDGEDASKVRLLVGRSNQNADANKEFALELKAVADSRYPELIKDIFIGKGSYNQDLASNAILLEFGTQTLEKERAEASAELMGGVIADTLYGGVSGAASGGEETQGEANVGAVRGIVWLLVLVAAAIAVFALLQTGRGRAAWERIKRGTSELTAGWLGKRNKE